MGKTLLDQMVTYGIEAKYPFAFVETMSFQALEFYKKMGFTLDSVVKLSLLKGFFL